jgi:putative oxidoreductase
MLKHRFEDYGVLLLRLALGTMFIAHSLVYMLMTLGLPGTAEFFVSIGLPAWLAYATFVVEAVGGILLILGVQVRWVARSPSRLFCSARHGLTLKMAGCSLPQMVAGNTPYIFLSSALPR